MWNLINVHNDINSNLLNDLQIGILDALSNAKTSISIINLDIVVVL